MKRRKQKPIPNAEWLDDLLKSQILSRGKRIGHLESIADTFELPWNDSVQINITPSMRLLIAPILRAEIARLKGDAK